MSILDNEYMICCMIFFFFFFFVHSVTAFKRGPHGRLVFAKCVLPSVNKIYYYFIIVVQSIVSLTSSLRGQLVKCFTTL